MEEFIKLLFDNEELTITQLLVFILWGFAGIIVGAIMDFRTSGEKIQNFDLKHYWKSNKSRTILSIISIPIGVAFGPQLLGVELSNWLVFVSALSTDKLWESLKYRRQNKADGKTDN